MLIIRIILAKGMQISEGSKCRQYNFMGNPAGAG